MKMKKVIAGLVIMSLATSLLTGCGGSANSNAGTSDGQEVTAASTQPSGTYEISLEKVAVPEPNMCAINGYLESPDLGIDTEYATLAQRREATLKGTLLGKIQSATGNPTETGTGHTIYQRLAQDGLVNCIISGFDIVDLSHDVYVPLDDIYILREETTGERVYVYQTDEEYEAAEERWEAGQAILNGEAPADEDGCIILNGQLLSLKPMIEEDGTLYLPMRDLAMEYNAYSECDDVLYILYVAGDGFKIPIPCTETSAEWSELEGMLFPIDVDAQTWTYYSTFGGTRMAPFEATVGLAKTSEHYYMTPEDIGVVFGWETYRDGNIISIITDELDNTHNYVMQGYTSTTTVFTPDDISQIFEAAGENQEDYLPKD